MTRKEQILGLFNSTGHGLEIGPSFNPLLPRSEGYDVEILDHASREDLVNKYRDAGVDLSRIEHVDHVSDGGSLVETIGREACFDYIVASHVVEHTVNLLGFLRDCERLLKPEGVLVLAVPDKRFSFDVLRPVTTTGDVLQAEVDGRKRHSLGALFDEVAYNCLRGGALAWPRSDDKALAFAASLEAAKHIFESTRADPVFHDIHAWQFTPSSFRLIVNDLHAIGYIGLKEAQVRESEAEFYVTLSRAGSGTDVDRLVLTQRVITECAQIQVPSA